MVHFGKILQTLRRRSGLSVRALGRACGLTDKAISSAENQPYCTMRPANLERVLEALGTDRDQFLRMAALEWDGSMEAELRLKLLTILLELTGDDLLQAHHRIGPLATCPTQATRRGPTGQHGVGVDPITPAPDQRRRAHRKSG